MAGYPELMNLGAAPADWQAAPLPMPARPLTLADLTGNSPSPIDVEAQLAAQNARAGMPTDAYFSQADYEGAAPSPRVFAAAPSAVPVETPRAAMRTQQRAVAGASPPSRGGLRSLLAKEAKAREQEALAAQHRLAETAEDFAKKSDALVGVQQEGINAQARAADTTAQAIEATRKAATDARMMDEGERLLEQDAVEARRQKIAQGYDKLSQEKPPQRTFGSRIMSALSMLIAGIADANTNAGGGQGQAVANAQRMMNDTIERSTNAYLREIETKKEKLTAEERGLKDFMAQVGNDRAARQYAIAQQWEDYGHLAQQIEANTTSEMKRNAAKELGAYAQQQTAAARLAGDSALAADTQERVRSLRDLSLNLQLKQAMGAGKPKDKPAAYGLRQLAEGTSGDATKAQEVSSGFSGVRTTIAQLKQMAAKGPTLSPDERATARRRLASLKSQFNGVFGDGTAPNEAQLEQLDDMFANPTEVNMGNASKQFETFDQDAKDLANAKMRPYGYALDDIDVRPE